MPHPSAVAFPLPIHPRCVLRQVADELGRVREVLLVQRGDVGVAAAAAGDPVAQLALEGVLRAGVEEGGVVVAFEPELDAGGEGGGWVWGLDGWHGEGLCWCVSVLVE